MSVAKDGVGETDVEVTDGGDAACVVVAGGDKVDVAVVHPASATIASSATQRLMHELYAAQSEASRRSTT